jgi:Ca2+-binding EF-hand superfamily protein
VKKTIRLFAFVPSLLLGVHLAQAGSEIYQGGGHGMTGVSMMNGSFGAMDANGDGIVEKSEFNDYYSRQFDALDTNKDGKLTLDEVNAGRNVPADNSATAHLDKRFYAADINHDGGLDRKEAEAMPMLSTYFDEVDANKDGKVTRQEYFDEMPLLHRAKQDKANAL